MTISFIGHGTLMFSFEGKIIHVDPVDEMADYKKLPKADIIIITHDHFDHLDLKAIQKVRTANTSVIVNESGAQKVQGGSSCATETPEIVAHAAKAFKPKVLYPYHTGDTDPRKAVALLKDYPEIEVRIRRLKWDYTLYPHEGDCSKASGKKSCLFEFFNVCFRIAQFNGNSGGIFTDLL